MGPPARRHPVPGGRLVLTALVLSALGGGVVWAERLALVGGTVHTMGPAGAITNAVILIEDGTIQAVGSDLRVPPGTTRIDTTGKVITPGLFDSLTRFGLVEISQISQTVDDRTEDDEITAAFDVADAINPRSTLLAINRAEGLTRAMVAPRSGGHLIAGQGAVIDLGGGEGWLHLSPAAMFADYGERGAQRAGGSRAAAMLRLREALSDAADWAAHREAFERGDRRSYALSRLDLEALAPVADSALPLVLGVNRASDIEAVLRLAGDLSLRVVLAGAAEGWMVADEIAAAGVPVLINPLLNRPTRFETLGATLENAARLHAAGVRIAFMSGGAHNARNLRQAAGNAVANGLAWEAALAAMTINPARIWGLEDRFGSVEAGRQADLVVWDGDPLEVMTFADVVLIRGRRMPLETRQTQLRERYRVLDGALPPAYRKP